MTAIRLIVFAVVCCCLTDASVDPDNTTVLTLSQPFSATPYNVTHTYFRDSLLSGEDGPRFDKVSKRCVWPSNDAAYRISYWIDEFSLPAVIRCFEPGDSQPVNITGADAVRETINRLIQRLADELELRFHPIDGTQYYRLMRLLTLEQNRKFQGLIPVHVHFRRKPYPQSSFGEFVTDRALAWEIYSDTTVYRQRAGRTEDLWYRLRHNLRHSLGLGHSTDRRSIMFPTNVLGQWQLFAPDVIAVHTLLCDSTADIRERIIAARIDKRARPLTTEQAGESIVVLRPKTRG
jgi:hypothetical protein